MEIKNFFESKTILITGGTGSLGNQLIERIARYNPKKVIIFSRDENKQYHMNNKYKYPFLDFELGDIRDKERLVEVTKGVDLIIHTAALKHVPPAEKTPAEFVKTNVLGSMNLVESAILNHVPLVIEIGTDKSVKPINSYGFTKALQEKIMISANNKSLVTKFIGVRYGNVIGSRGSVIPFFIDKVKKGEEIPVTVPEMTRFLLTLNEAVELIFYAIANGKGGEIFVRKMPAANVLDIAKAISFELSNKEDYPIKVVGIRPGEKIHELLVSEEEMRRSIEKEGKYIIYESAKILPSKSSDNLLFEYGSNNTNQLDISEIIKKIKSSGCFNQNL